MKLILEKETFIWWKTVLWEKGSGTSENTSSEVCSLSRLQQEFSWDPHICPCLGLVFQFSGVLFVEQHFPSCDALPSHPVERGHALCLAPAALALLCYWELAARPVSPSLTMMFGGVWGRAWAMAAIQNFLKSLKAEISLHPFLAMLLLFSLFSPSPLFTVPSCFREFSFLLLLLLLWLTQAYVEMGRSVPCHVLCSLCCF